MFVALGQFVNMPDFQQQKKVMLFRRNLAAGQDYPSLSIAYTPWSMIQITNA
jgi:hypothetical protein